MRKPPGLTVTLRPSSQGCSPHAGNRSSETEADAHAAAAAAAATPHAEAEEGRIAAAAAFRGPQVELLCGDDRVDIVRLTDPPGAGAGHRPDHGDLPARGVAGRFQVTGFARG